MTNMNKQKPCVYTIQRTEKQYPPCAQTEKRASRTDRGIDVRMPTPKHRTKTRQKCQCPDNMPGTHQP